MGADTPTLGMYKPGGGSSGLITPDETADIDRLNSNFDILDQEALSVRNRLTPLEDQNRQYRGPAASLSGLTGMRLGDEYQETDADKRRWKYDGTNWLTFENGLYLIRPTSVTGGTITDGKVVLSTGDTVTINGVFSSRFRAYLIRAQWGVSGGVNGAALRLAVGGVVSNASYDQQALVANGASVAGASLTGQTSWSAIGVAGNGHASTYELTCPGLPEGTYVNAKSSIAPVGWSALSGFHTVNTAYDGFRLELSTKAGGRAFTSGEIAVYGLV